MKHDFDSNATIRLWGHGCVAAQLDVERYPHWAWMARVGISVVIWLVATAMTLLFTFDPFIASFPFVLGVGKVYSRIRGRYKVKAFSGVCPRCSSELHLKRGAKINLPHRLDCFQCHFEPELHLETG